MKLKKINSNKAFIFIMILVTIFRIWLLMGLPLVGTGQSLYDDTLMVNLADNILKGEWLGVYNDKTLIKGVAYPLFLAFCSYINVPYLMILGILYSFSAFIFTFVFKRFIKRKRYFLLVYTFILFSPAMFTYHYIQRVYRMSIIPSEILLIVACFSAMYIKRNEKVKTLLPWAIGGGISVSFFWITREDSIWMAPFIVGATLILVATSLYRHRREKLILFKKIFIFILPIIILASNINIIKLINYKYYGVYEINDLKNTYFSEVIGNIYSIKQNEKKEYVWVNRETLNKLYEISPTLATIKNEVEVSMDRWSIQGTNPDDKEVEKDYFMWALRDGVKLAGHYIDSIETNNFYKKINDEIVEAFKDGRLEKSEGVKFSSLARPFRKEYIIPTIKCSIESIDWIIDYEKCQSELKESIPPNYILRKIEAITGDYLLNPKKTYFAFRGWVFANNNQDVLKAEIVDANDNIYSGLDFMKFDDVYEHFLNQGYAYNNAKESRFDIILDSIDTDKLFMNIYINNEIVDKIDLSTNNGYYETENYKLNIDNLEIYNIVDAYWDKAEENVNISNNIIKLYKNSGDILAFLGLICYLVLTIFMLCDLKNKKYTLVDSWIILTGVFFSFIILVLGVSYNYFEAWNRSKRNVYLSGAYPLIQMFISLSIIITFNKIKDIFDFKRNRKEIKKNEIDNSDTML